MPYLSFNHNSINYRAIYIFCIKESIYFKLKSQSSSHFGTYIVTNFQLKENHLQRRPTTNIFLLYYSYTYTLFTILWFVSNFHTNENNFTSDPLWNMPRRMVRRRNVHHGVMGRGSVGTTTAEKYFTLFYFIYLFTLFTFYL